MAAFISAFVMENMELLSEILTTKLRPGDALGKNKEVDLEIEIVKIEQNAAES